MGAKTTICLVFTALLGATITASSTDAQPQLTADEIVIEEKFGAMVRKSRWTSATIPVCWENPTPADTQYRKLVQEAVKETWAVYAPIVVKDEWTQCASAAKGIRIKIGDSQAQVEALGKYLDGRPNGMTLNFQFKKWGTNCQAQPEACIPAIAVHEFGHALGFSHEDNRTDTPEECKRDMHQGVDGDYYVTQYDRESVMNYCTKPYLGNGKLSKLDIEAVSKVYSGPAP